MRRGLSFGGFVVLAAALHLGVFALWGDKPGSVEAAGAGGSELITLAGADGALEALIADWERPPELTSEAPDTPADPVPEPIADLPPEISTEITPDTPPPTAALSLPQAPTLRDAPMMPQAAPEPPKQPEPPKPEAPPAPKKPKAAKKPAAPQARAQAAQQAAGAGGAAAGRNGRAEAATLSPGRERDLRAEWGAVIRARIERRKAYPPAAGSARGRVVVQLTVTSAGALRGVSVVKSSGVAAFDAAAVQAVRAAGRFPVAPKELTARNYTFTLPMSFAR